MLHASKIGEVLLFNEVTAALVERWRPETNTFHFPHGEATVTLEDVSLLLGLCCTGEVVIWHTMDNTVMDMCAQYLPEVPPSSEGRSKYTVNMRWLRESLERHQPTDLSTEDDLDRWTRGYLWLIVGGLLMSEKSGARVNSMWLPLLVDFDRCGTYSWGSTVLAYLYRDLYKASKRTTKEIDGCGVLLQTWFWFRFPCFSPLQRRPRIHRRNPNREVRPPTFPFAARYLIINLLHY